MVLIENKEIISQLEKDYRMGWKKLLLEGFKRETLRLK
jgi:hypothetical protein